MENIGAATVGLLIGILFGTRVRRASEPEKSPESRSSGSAGWKGGQPSPPMPVMPRQSGILFTPPETWERVPEAEMTPGHIYGTIQPIPKPGTGRILVYPDKKEEANMLSAHWEAVNDGQARGTYAEGYAPAVLMWAHHMPSTETFFITDEGETWMPLDEALYNRLFKDL